MRLAELAQYGWMPLAAALFGTVKWQLQWLHHNFLPVIGLRVHAKVPPPPLTDQQLVALLGLWERGAHRGLQCRALVQAAQLDFGLLIAFEALVAGAKSASVIGLAWPDASMITSPALISVKASLTKITPLVGDSSAHSGSSPQHRGCDLVG